MKAIKLKDVKKGDYFVLTTNVKFEKNVPYGKVKSKYVRVRGEYDRSIKKYEVYEFDNICDYTFMKGDRIVYIDFMF